MKVSGWMRTTTMLGRFVGNSEASIDGVLESNVALTFFGKLPVALGRCGFDV